MPSEPDLDSMIDASVLRSPLRTQSTGDHGRGNRTATNYIVPASSQIQEFRSGLRRCTASARCLAVTLSLPDRPAMARDSLRMQSSSGLLTMLRLRWMITGVRLHPRAVLPKQPHGPPCR